MIRIAKEQSNSIKSIPDRVLLRLSAFTLNVHMLLDIDKPCQGEFNSIKSALLKGGLNIVPDRVLETKIRGVYVSKTTHYFYPNV